MQENRAAEGGEQDHAHEGVGCKERGIQTTEIASADESMLVNEQTACGNHTCECDWSKLRDHKQPDKREKRQRVKRTRNPERTCNPKTRRNGFQSLASIKIVILTGIEHVEAGSP